MTKITGTNIGVIGDLPITEDLLHAPVPELSEFIDDINQLNNEVRRSPRSWLQKERARARRRQVRQRAMQEEAATLTEDIR